MKNKNLIYIIILFFSCNSNKRDNIVYLYSQDKLQTITIISDYNKNERIVANGKHTSKPKTNYYKLDISNITELGDEIGVCWSINGHNWELVNDKAKVIKVNIDTSKYVFRKSWFRDKRKIPTPKYYRQTNCFTVGMLNYSKHKPLENGSVSRGLN